MSDAFNDVITEEDTVSSDDTNDEIDTSSIADTFQAVDGVRSELPEEDELNDDKRYEDPESGEQADDVDPRGLSRQPTLNELRYYARQGPYGQAIVEKPIRDAFKHGFTIRGDFTEDTSGEGKARDYLDEYKAYYTECERTSRRDGLTVLQHLVSDANPIEEPIDRETASHEGFQIWTLDNLTDDLADTTVADHTEYDHDQIYVTEGAEHGGVAIVDDIRSPDHGKVLGYGIEHRQDSERIDPVVFIHEDRCEAFRWNEWVDGNLGNNVTGNHVGESVITNVLEPLKATHMGYWAMKNILFQYSAPLHAVEPPETWGEEEYDVFTEKLDDISMATDATLPPGAELSVAESTSEFDPEPIYNVLVNAICAGTVFTRPVLEGTQTGTVSGSETSLKGYFNEIHLLRTERIEEKFRTSLKKVSQYDPETVPPLTNPDNLTFEWGPLFKATDIEQAEGAVSLVTAATNGVKNYVLTPDEARNLVEEEWARFDIDVDLDTLSEEDLDDLDRINLREVGRGPQDDEPDVRGSRMQQNGGGQEAGENRSSSQPQRADARSNATSSTDDEPSQRADARPDELSEETIERLADAVTERLTEN
jgi:hypothetical protein